MEDVPAFSLSTMRQHRPSSFVFSLRLGTCVAALLLICCTPLCQAQYGGARNPSMGTASNGLPTYLKHAGIAQNLNRKLPLSAAYLDSTGKPVTLGQYFDNRPVVLAQVYFSCGMLCPQVMHGAADALKQTGLKAGKDYQVVIASFDPKDTAQQAAGEKQLFLSWLGDPGAASGVHFLTGQQPSIDALSSATGFHYVRVPGPDGKMDQFAHSSVIIVATPDGRLSKYFAGIQYAPRDLRLAMVDASNHKIGSAADLFLLYCCSYNPSSGRYTVSILRVLGLAACVTILIILGMIYLLTRKPTGRNFPPSSPSAA
ncbi:MAG TPA: SCO family protein [Acidobacteriaceae bacterium]|nr:SCO family protein [Acidobacteriaceae bacterium]